MFFKNIWSRLRGRRDLGAQKIDRFIEQFATSRKTEPITLIQLGSNDGKTNDPFFELIKTYDWNALLVEPVPNIFKRLSENHCQSPNVVLRQVGVATESSEKEFYYLRHDPSGESPWWHDQLGSFDREIVENSRSQVPKFEDLFEQTLIDCITVNDLLSQYNPKQVDILHTDLEGFDDQIILSLNWERWLPKVILYEHKHLSEDRAKHLESVLESKGYCFVHSLFDTLAYLDL